MAALISLFILLPVALASVSPVNAENLILNPGFEETDTAGKPLNWSLNPSKGNSLDLDQETFTLLPVEASNTVRTSSPEGGN
ncbi:MAG: hypothetical protein ABIK20_07380 [Candidatus Omnitrophota bacterium]